MGLAASQARYLTLTARKSDLELQSQTINSRRIQLSYKTAEIARAYSEGMNNKKIQIYVDSLNQTNGTATKAWTELTFANLMKNGYMLIGTNGKKLQPSPYVVTQEVTKAYHFQDGVKDDDIEISENDYNNLDESIQAAFATTKNGTTKTYKLKNQITEEVYNALVAAGLTKYSEKYSSTPSVTTTYDCDLNDDYSNGLHGQDIQTLLVSGKAQIVTADFFDFLCKNGKYNYETGVQSGISFEKLLDDWQKQTKTASIVDWRSDETNTFKQKNYTEDDEAVIAKYEADTAEVQAQDKILEMEEKNIETQHKAIETELENVKKVIQKNIEDTFKIFS